MSDLLLRTIYVAFLRIAPALINLVCISYLAKVLSPLAYGTFSTTSATITLIGSVVFGPLILSTVPCRARHSDARLKRSYENAYVTFVAILCAAVCSVGFIVALLGLLPFSWFTLIACSGLFLSLQEMQRARLCYQGFAVASTFQSLTHSALVLGFARPTTSIPELLYFLAASQAAGSLFALLFLRPTGIDVKNIQLLIQQLRLGFPATASTFVADTFILGFRYIIAFFGTGGQLAMFSYSLDLARRLFGISYSVVGFTVQAEAFSASSRTTRYEFLRTLIKGSVIAAILSILFVTAILALSPFTGFTFTESPSFDPLAMTLVATAVLISRSARMVLSPLAMFDSRPWILTCSYLIAGPLGLTIAVAGGLLHNPVLLYSAYPLFFAIWAAVCSIFLARSYSLQSIWRYWLPSVSSDASLV